MRGDDLFEGFMMVLLIVLMLCGALWLVVLTVMGGMWLFGL